MEQKFSDVYRTSFLTLDRYLQQSNAAQFYFRPLLPPLNTVSGEFYSLSPAQGTDPSIRINKYSSNGTFLGFGYLYDTSFNVPPADGSGGTIDVSGGYWTLTGSNIYNNNPGFVGVRNTNPQYPLDASGYGAETVINATTDSKKAIRVTQVRSNADAPAEIYFDKVGNPGGAVGIDASSERAMFVYYNGEDRITITPNGYVGIGTAPGQPTTLLDVSGGTVHIVNSGNTSLNIGDTLPPAWNTDDIQVVNGGGESAAIILGADGSGALRFVNANSQTYIQSGIDISNNSGCKMNFTRFASVSQTMTIDTSSQYVYIGGNSYNAFDGNQFVVDGSAEVQRLTISSALSLADISTNPLPSQLVIQGDTDRLRIGSYFTGGVGVAGAIQSSDFFPDVSGNPSVDHGRPLLLNPSGGTVRINSTNLDAFSPAVLEVSGQMISQHHLPQTSYTYDLGSSSAYWRDLYLSSGTIYMGPSSRIRSSNPLALDLSGNGGLYVTSNATVGRVYDTAFNPAPALAPQTITVLLNNHAVTVSGSVALISLGTVVTKGNYIIKQEWSFGNGSDMSGGNIYTLITTSVGSYFILVPATTIPSSGGAVSTTYTTFGGFGASDGPSITIDTTEINAAGGSLVSTTVTVSILYLSASP